MTGNNAYLGYNNIDLWGIKEIQFTVQAQPRSGALGGVIEVHLDKPDGKLIGKSDTIVSKDADFSRFMGGGDAKPKDKRGAKAAAPKAPPKIDFDAIMKLMNVQAKATIAATEGFHNIYFVFKNDRAGEDKIIVQAVQINFQNAASAKNTIAGK
jgi:cytochrome c